MSLDKKQLMNLLKNILEDKDKENRQDKIHEFQEIIWNNEDDNIQENVLEAFNELALDLEFYEPNPEWRSQDPSFYGDEELDKRLRKELARLENMKGQSKKKVEDDEDDFEDEEDDLEDRY